MSNEKIYPDAWQIAADYDPNKHLMNLRGKDYLDVQQRMIWFVRDQRDFIARGLATCGYIVRTELVEQDRQAGFAHFKTYVRDVLGNEATMYGSETAKDFTDYAEKASTKSLGRALAMLGYGTQFAPEMDEGDRIVDSPVERRATNTTGARNSETKTANVSAPTTKTTFAARPPVLHAPADEPVAKSDAKSDAKKLETLADVQLALANYRNILGITDTSIIATDQALNYQASLARRSEYVEAWKRASVERQKAGTR